MHFHQKSIVKTTFLLSLIVFFSNYGFAQFKSKTLPTGTHINGIDHFPVYKTSQKNSFIDSIIYNGPFVTFCVQFEKPTSDGHYLFESVNSEHGWTCETAAGLCHPVLIKNIRKNGQLVSDYLKVTPLDLVFENKENTSTKISCEFQFWRKDFVHGEARLSESLIREYGAKEVTFVEFKGIRIRTQNYPKPVKKEYVEDFNWARNDLLNKIDITLNEVPLETPTKVVSDNSAPEQSILETYKVQKISLNQLFLKKVWHKANTTVFRVQYYAPSSNYTSISLHNKGNRKYYIKTPSKRIKMRALKNVLINQFLLKEEIANKESLSLKKAPSLYLLTYDIYFDRLPDDLNSFDLIEGNPKENTTVFDFYSIRLK